MYIPKEMWIYIPFNDSLLDISWFWTTDSCLFLCRSAYSPRNVTLDAWDGKTSESLLNLLYMLNRYFSTPCPLFKFIHTIQLPIPWNKTSSKVQHPNLKQRPQQLLSSMFYPSTLYPLISSLSNHAWAIHNFLKLINSQTQVLIIQEKVHEISVGNDYYIIRTQEH